MEITKETAKSIIKSRKLVPTVGNYVLKVTNSTPYTREDGTKTNIVNFAAMTPYMVDLGKQFYKNGDFVAATNQSLSASLLEGQYVPAKNERVKVFVDTVTTKNGVTGLFVVGVSEIPLAEAKGVSFDWDDESDDSFNEIATAEKAEATT